MRCFFFFHFLNLLLVLSELVFKLLDTLALLYGYLGWNSTFGTLSVLLEKVCRILHTFEERAFIDTAQIWWHHVQVLKFCIHGGINTNSVNDLRTATNVDRGASSTAARFWAIFTLLRDQLSSKRGFHLWYSLHRLCNLLWDHFVTVNCFTSLRALAYIIRVLTALIKLVIIL